LGGHCIYYIISLKDLNVNYVGVNCRGALSFSFFIAFISEKENEEEFKKNNSKME
jgi:hypothetical protein